MRACTSWLKRGEILHSLGAAAKCVGCCHGERPRSRICGATGEWVGTGQVLDARSGRAVSMEKWLEQLAGYDVIYLGEEHHNRAHIDAAWWFFGRWPIVGGGLCWRWRCSVGTGRRSSIATSRRKEPSRADFLERVGWKQNWGGAFEDYEPLVQFAREHQLSLVAMNPPKFLISPGREQGTRSGERTAGWRQWGWRGGHRR